MSTEEISAAQANGKLLRRYLADWSTTKSAPKLKSGYFALLGKVSGKVWIAKSIDLDAIVRRYHTTIKSKGKTVRAWSRHINEMIVKGEPISLYVQTREDMDIDQLIDMLEESGDMLERATRKMEGPGNLFVVRHVNGDYFLVRDRLGRQPDTVLNHYLARLNTAHSTFGYNRNRVLHDFINAHADDIIKEKNFYCNFVTNFHDSEDALKKMADFAINSPMGTCLNRNVFGS